MSVKRGSRAIDIAAGLRLDKLDTPARQRSSEPKTAAGELLAEYRGGLEEQNSRLQSRVAELEEDQQKWAGATPSVPLDPTLIEPSRFANRLAESFAAPEFQAFKAEIIASGGNVQPIKVAPIPGTNPQRYSVVYGHRRHRACLEAGLRVNALIENLSERAKFVEMDRENRGREDLAAYEQGIWYLRAVTPAGSPILGDLAGWGLFGSKADLASALGLDKGNVSKACQIAELPEVVLDAFPRRNDIQFNWATALHRAMTNNGQELVARANAVLQDRKKGAELSAKDVYARLTASEGSAEAGPSELEIIGRSGGAGARMTRDKKGRTTIAFEAPLDEATADKIVQFLASVL